MKKTRYLLLSAIFLSVNSWGAPVFLPTGSNLTLGSGSNLQLVSAYTNNPAMPAMSLEWEEWAMGVGVFSSIGGGYEIGQVDNLQDDLDALSSELNNQQDLTLDKAEALKAKFDSFLLKAGENGYLNVYGGMEGPLSPLILTSRGLLGGSLVFDGNISGEVGISVLDAPLKVNQLAPPGSILETNTALYIKTAMIGEASMSYSRPVHMSDTGTLTLGLRGVYYMAGLRKTLIGLAVADDMGTIADEERKKTIDFQSAFGIDAGLLWQTRNHRIGVMGKNLNSPFIDYQPIGENCEQKTGAAQDACLIAVSFAEEISLKERWVMDPQANVELAWFNDGLDTIGQVTFDTNPVHDPIGNRFQWMTISGGFLTKSWLVPGIRLGIRKNMAGSKLTYATAGFTLFKFMNLDVGYSAQSIAVDGQGQPRSAYVNLGLELLF